MGMDECKVRDECIVRLGIDSERRKALFIHHSAHSVEYYTIDARRGQQMATVPQCRRVSLTRFADALSFSLHNKGENNICAIAEKSEKSEN